MKATNKIVNDPIYGLVHIGHPLLIEIINHPFFQRLRRISQMGLASLVYPGATHTRFLHSLGAFHLMQKSIEHLKKKGQVISDEENVAAQIAILLHDIGHGPFSHTLEGKLLPFDHETLSMAYIELLEKEMKSKTIGLAKKIFSGTYPKKFLCQLVKSQLDVDRLDYLARDSYYTGVVEGKVGYNRILNMMDVKKNQLVIEEKGWNSIANFLQARHFMHHQVYFHKVSMAMEEVMSRAVERIRFYAQKHPQHVLNQSSVAVLWNEKKATPKTKHPSKEQLIAFAQLDDADIWQLIKQGARCEDKVTALLCKTLLDRKIFQITEIEKPMSKSKVEECKKKLEKKYHLSREEAAALVFEKRVEIKMYSKNAQSLWVLKKEGSLVSLDQISPHFLETKTKKNIFKHYFCSYKGD